MLLVRKKGGAPGWTLRLFVRTCFHKKYMWIFEHNFVADKKKNTQAGCRPASVFYAVCSKICRKDTCIRL